MWRVSWPLLVFALSTVSVVCTLDNDTSPVYFSTTPKDSQRGSFSSPVGSSLSYSEKKYMRIAWNSTEEPFFLILHQRDNDHGMLIQEIKGTPGSVDSYLWLVQTMNESLPSEYVIQGFPANFWSSAFTITNGSEAVSSSASIATATSTRGSNELSGLPRATFIPLSTPTTSASKSSSGGLSMGTTIGLAVGFTAGSIGILIYLLNFLYKRRKAKANPYTAKSAPEGGADEHLPEVHTYEPVPIEGDAKPVELEVKPAEMDGTSTCAELPAEKRLLRVEDFDELVVSPRK